MGAVPFTDASCGQTKGECVPVGGALNPGDQVEINGSIDLSSCIVGNSNASVFTISLAEQSPILYNYVISVVAEGPPTKKYLAPPGGVKRHVAFFQPGVLASMRFAHHATRPLMRNLRGPGDP